MSSEAEKNFAYNDDNPLSFKEDWVSGNSICQLEAKNGQRVA